ncbi:hypothetical protein A2115_02825 [Candidatus Woesebacteria bacterium GWA1_41_8]|jgi:FMN phosphatase YigB (HAD superfamily)|uniref:FCP1 homology domain-containing protein n=1 Tax=Candidatus Woesebacteria bacterium GWA1_41_8 TaxID=1802471 RepID=A0A1F7WL09_9BACT|nr:MAG: hypothetical protein A2115_02825 [Candidatus Woesebacteria bacterium GWA1_41_8]
MIKALVFDLSRTLLFPVDKNYQGKLNALYKELKDASGFSFLDHFRLDENIMIYLRSLKKTCNLYIFTSGIIQDDPAIKPRLEEIFEKVFSAEKMGLNKKDMNAYTKLSKELGFKSYEIKLIDDSEVNVKAARSAGINAVLFSSLNDLRKKIQEHLSSN